MQPSKFHFLIDVDGIVVSYFYFQLSLSFIKCTCRMSDDKFSFDTLKDEDFDSSDVMYISFYHYN